MENGSNGRSLGDEKTLMELVLIYLPFMIYGCTILYPALYVLDHNIPILLISSFPAPFQNHFTIPMFLVMETSLTVFYVSWSTYIIFIILSFVTTFIESVQLEIWKLDQE